MKNLLKNGQKRSQVDAGWKLAAFLQHIDPEFLQRFNETSTAHDGVQGGQRISVKIGD